MSERTQSTISTNQNTDLATTPDGARTKINDLNVGVQAQETDKQGRPIGKLRKIWRNLNLAMAGMYTGLNCYGTPHERHSYRQDSADDADKPDNRPL